MKQIAENIIIETEYTGVTLGAIVQPNRVIYIDAPLLPEHARLWRIAATARKKIPQQVILLDAHHDRTIGSRYLECTIIAHEQTHLVYQNRPVTFKPISQNSGCEWEKIKIQNGFRWIYPEIVFSQRLDLHQSELHVDLQYHEGPSTGSSWVEIPARKVIFIGDTVVAGQVPFLHTAKIGPWLKTLDDLEKRYNEGCIIVGGRNGLIEKADIQAMRAFLLKAQDCLTDYSAVSETDERIDSLIPLLGIDSFFKIKKDQMGDMVERLSYGLHHYFRRNYMGIDEIIYGSNEPEAVRPDDEAES
ncbi:MAG: hypothetical protein IJI41_04140 [Anaerolineaceae bacterium]|nr:hypothetical protein [Anaerolineaceae bacterium]